MELKRNSFFVLKFNFIILLISLSIPLCFSQEFTYFTKPNVQPDPEPETYLEDVTVVDSEPVNEITAVATIYEMPNTTDADDKAFGKETKVSCLTNTTNDLTVEILNTTGLMSLLYVNPAVKKRSTPSNCTIVLFYARWCPFSSKAAPHFNALPRVFPHLKTVAVDATLHTSVNTYFGILSVPTVMLFRNGKLVAKFNESTFSLAKFADFITGITDLEVFEKLNVTSQDFQGPLPSTQTKEVDLYLYLAWIFIIICFINYARKTSVFMTVVESVRVTWREAEAQHEHQD